MKRFYKGGDPPREAESNDVKIIFLLVLRCMSQGFKKDEKPHTNEF